MLRYKREDAERWLVDRAGRAVFTNAKHALPETPTSSFLPVGLLYRIDRDREPLTGSEEARLWESYEFQNLDESFAWRGGPRDVSADFILCEVLLHRAEYLFRADDPDGAVASLETLRALARVYKEVLNNAGSILLEKDRFAQACTFYEDALRVDPAYADCRRNYAWALLRREGHHREAIAEAERSLEELEPSPAFLFDLAEVYIKAGRFRNARDAFLAAGRANPKDDKAWRRAGEVTEEHLKDERLAKLYYETSLRRRPTQPDLIEKLHGPEAREQFEKRAKAALEAMSNRVAPLGFNPSVGEVANHGHRN